MGILDTDTYIGTTSCEFEGRDLGHVSISQGIPKGFPDGIVVKNLPAHTGDAGGVGSTPGSGRSPGVGNGHPLQYHFSPRLQYSCLENSMDRGAWQATVYGVTKSRMQLNTHACQYQRLPGNQQKLGERHRTDSSS